MFRKILIFVTNSVEGFFKIKVDDVHFGPLVAEIGPVVWGTPPNFNGFRVVASLLHGILVVGVSQTLRR